MKRICGLLVGAALALGTQVGCSSNVCSKLGPALDCGEIGKELYSYSFSNAKELNDWKVEGYGEMTIQDGRLILKPEFQSEMQELLKQGKFPNNNFAKDNGEFLRELIVAKYPEKAAELNDKKGYFYSSGIFRGGHVNYWCTKKTPQNYMVEFDFESLSPSALHMVMFSALGLKGEDVFDSSLKKRYGLAKEIMFGDIHQYRISFFAPTRGTANMRRAPGRVMTTTGPDYCSEDPDAVHKLQVVRFGNNVDFFVDGKHTLSFYDDEPLPGGNWGFRVMAMGKGAYDNVKVYDLRSDPIINRK